MLSLNFAAMFWNHLIEFLTLVTITIQLRTHIVFEPIVMYNLRDCFAWFNYQQIVRKIYILVLQII